jgi:hypothetical protein
MAKLEQGSSIADAIINNRSKQQPVQRITAPPFSGPDSGTAPSHLPGVITSSDLRRDVCVDVPSFVQRLQYRSYTGAAATAIGSNYNYAYVISDDVPQGRYWVVEYASGVILGGSGTAVNRIGLWAVPPGPRPAPNIAAFSDNPNFFADSEAAPGQIVNGPPLQQGIRVDEAEFGTSNSNWAIRSDIPLVRSRRLILRAGWCLLVWGGGDGFGNGGVLTEQFRLNMQYSEFLLSEDTEVK